jgi:hypothetical protein
MGKCNKSKREERVGRENSMEFHGELVWIHKAQKI